MAKKKRNKQKRRHNACSGNVVDHDLQEDTSSKNTAVGSNIYICPSVGVSSAKSSGVAHCLAGLGAWPGKKKRRIKKRKTSAQKCNDIHHEHSECIRCPLERDLSTKLAVGKFSEADSEVTRCDAEVISSEDNNKCKNHNKRHYTTESNVISLDFQDSGVGPSPVVNNNKLFREVNVSSVSELAEQVSGTPVCVDISSVKKQDAHSVDENTSLEVKIIKTSKRKKRLKTSRGKRRKLSDSLADCSDSIKEITGTPVLVARNTSLDHSVGVLASGCLENMFGREVVAGRGAPLQVVGDMLLERASDGCSDIEHPTGESRNIMGMENTKETTSEGRCVEDVSVLDVLGENPVQAKRAKHNIILNAVNYAGSAENLIDQTAILCKGKVSCDASARDPSSADLGQKRKSKMEDTIPPLMQIGAVEDDAPQIINKDKLALHILQPSPVRAPTGSFRKKLLVLDVNGLLADIVSYVPYGYKADTIIGTKSVFKRPFCDDFLQFCFERFNVGVWSSRTKRNVEWVLDFLMKETRHNLLFCWVSHS
ncbi:unnamed protein product [Ilex paraguariensis]|uniref:Mitochondrial import inner membrane translocase subunit TIM50 n=1 Tax=Ilex paraguariensis TaxID=185542 RepID=A0ABC8RSI3_9AQUA